MKRQHLIYVLIAITLMVKTNQSLSQIVEEFQPKITWGGLVNSIDAYPYASNVYTCFATTEYGGLYISKNNGDDWARVYSLPVQLLRDVKICLTEPKTIFVTASRDTKSNNGGGVWVSHDFGNTWTQVVLNCTSLCQSTTRPNGFGISVGKDNHVVLAGTEGGVYLSKNNGYDWKFKLINSDCRIVSTLVLDENHYIAGAEWDGGIYYSEDGGETWHNERSGVAVHTDNNGAHHGITEINLHALSGTALSNTDVFLTTGDHGLFYSNDFGKNYQQLIGINSSGCSPFFLKVGKSRTNSSTSIVLYYGGNNIISRKNCIRVGNSYDFSSSWENFIDDPGRYPLHHTDERDIVLSKDGFTPIFLANDGGIEKTIDGGTTWGALGNGINPLHALQIYEVTGTRVMNPDHYDLYIGTQHNHLWTSNDNGVSWPKPEGAEGLLIGTPRISQQDNYFVNYESCAGCGNYISSSHFGNPKHFNDHPDFYYSPFYVKEDTYIQIAKQDNGTWPVYITYDKGDHWTKIAESSKRFVLAPPAIVKIPNSNTDDYCIFLPYFNDNNEFQLAKIPSILSSGPDNLLTPDYNGIKLGDFFSPSYQDVVVFGVNPKNSNQLIVPDISSNKMKKSSNGGLTWNVDEMLTQLVTKNGALLFSDESSERFQVHCISFNPEDPSHILVGTQEAGIIESTDGGNTWRRIRNTEQITYITSIFWSLDNTVLVSTNDRGLWKLDFNVMPIQWNSLRECLASGECVFVAPDVALNESILNIKPIDSDNIPYLISSDEKIKPIECNACDYILVSNGHITDLTYREGKVVGYSVNSSKTEKIILSGNKNKYSIGIKKQFGKLKDIKGINFLKKHNKVISGLIIQDGKLSTIFIKNSDMSTEEFKMLTERPPIPDYTKTKIVVSSSKSNRSPFYILPEEEISIKGLSFIPGKKNENIVRLTLDDREIGVANLDSKGDFIYTFFNHTDIGHHTFKITQTVGDYQVKRTYDFITPDNDK